jgi:hypothetical protein
MTRKTPKRNADVEGDPKRGDEILKRMLQTKPKQHKELVQERKAQRGKKQRADK